MKHACLGIIISQGQKFWGNPDGSPEVEPMPQELLDRHPDVLTDWTHCDCGEPLCGQDAPFKFVVSDTDGSNPVTVWLCAKHYDEMVESQFPVWHECFV